MSRRRAIQKATAAALLPLVAALIPTAASAAADQIPQQKSPLEDVKLGQGHWTQASSYSMPQSSDIVVSATFATYAARFLIRYDQAVSTWWRSVDQRYSLMSDDTRQAKLGQTFGGFSMSVQLALDDFVRIDNDAAAVRNRFRELMRLFVDKYARDNESKRQVGILFATLPAPYQPTDILKDLASTSTLASSSSVSTLPETLSRDFTALLPADFTIIQQANSMFKISPPIQLFEVGIDEEFGQTATATAFGPLSAVPLKRELPQYSPDIYTMFGISGATGCALTHTVVIPLDVLKTRSQTDPEASGLSLLAAANNIIEKEGLEGLLLGAQATIAGYLWYGLSVYPSYTFFKRFLGRTFLPPEVAAIHINDIALVAGAIAAVIASIGLTPLECCRIRSVADPEKYRPLGLVGTLREVSLEDPRLGWRTLYGGFPSLLTRQVIFGSVKFLAFERACDTIFGLWPVLHDATWTSLTVSLVAGGLSGCLSSVVSQPADSVLTYVAQNSNGRSSLGVIEGSRVMVEQEGIGSLFRGLGSRCVWAGSIIAGQFLLYDVFRTFFGVNNDDLSQIYQVVISSQS